MSVPGWSTSMDKMEPRWTKHIHHRQAFSWMFAQFSSIPFLMFQRFNHNSHTFFLKKLMCTWGSHATHPASPGASRSYTTAAAGSLCHATATGLWAADVSARRALQIRRLACSEQRQHYPMLGQFWGIWFWEGVVRVRHHDWDPRDIFLNIF